MAEARKNPANKSADSSNNKCFEADCNNTQPKALTTFDIICVCISMGTFVADLTTGLLALYFCDIMVIASYWREGYQYWCMSTLCLVVTSSIVLHIFSLRWHMLDDVGSLSRWITHICQVGIIHRYCLLIKSIFGAEPSCPRSLARLHWQQSDLHMLHLFQAFVQAAPLLLLQLYIMHCPAQPHTPTNFMMVSAVSSCWSLAWAGAAYARGAGGAPGGGRGWVLQSSWHCALLAARMSALLMFAVVFGWWTFVPLGIHWGAMTIWIISQKTNFCPSQVEEFFYNCVVGIIYCFCYFNLHSGRTRARLLAFYSIAVSQNLASVLLFLLLTDEREAWVVAAAVSVVGGTIIGLASMITYYRWFHPNGPISWRRNSEDDLEKNTKGQALEHETASRADTRSLKTMWVDKADSVVKNDSNTVEVVPTAEVESTDKKLLLEHWIARSCTPTFVSVPIAAPTTPHTTLTDDHSGLEFHTAENTPDSTLVSNDIVVPDEPAEEMPQGSTTLNKTLTKTKRSGICSTNELDLQLAKLHSDRTELDPVEQFRASTLSLQKRRGICSSDELKEDLSNENIVGDNYTQRDSSHPIVSTRLSPDTDSSNKKSSDSIDMDLDLSFSDINSSDINEFNENIVQKLCLSTLKNIKGVHEEADIQNIQRIALDILKEMYCKKGNLGSQLKQHNQQVKEVETLSVHDYENICAVNIAREAWGLRSWGCYSDIENWLHDDSVVRDRRSDTFTSASSEISSCISTELRNNILSAPPIPARRNPTYSNVFVKPEPSRREPYVNTVFYELSKCNDKGEATQMKVLESQDCDIFIAKPCMIDQNASQLHTILEELDENESARKPRLNSESSLVATIDEIRKGDITNSPRNVYHRTENIWDSPQLNANCSSLKRALWKEPSKLHSNNINFISDVDSGTDKLSSNRRMIKSASTHKLPCSVVVDKTLNKSLCIENISPVSPQVPTSRRKVKINKLNNAHTISKKKAGIKATEAHQLCHGDVAYLARLVSEPLSRDAVVAPVLVSNERFSSSLQSLISKDNDSTHVINNTETKTIFKKSSRNKPRRKFSLLRERFEPKSKNSDEEVLYESSDSLKSPSAAGRGRVYPTRGSTDEELVVSYRENVTTNKCEADAEEIVIKVSAAAGASSHNGEANIKDKRTLFLKQVLIPNKLNGRSKKQVQ